MAVVIDREELRIIRSIILTQSAQSSNIQIQGLLPSCLLYLLRIFVES